MFRAGQIISFVLNSKPCMLFCDPIYCDPITFIIHIEGPIRSYEVLLEQRRKEIHSPPPIPSYSERVVDGREAH